ncbi:unnamed protein product, partial [Meganyctiphanes norvegica]
VERLLGNYAHWKDIVQGPIPPFEARLLGNDAQWKDRLKGPIPPFEEKVFNSSGGIRQIHIVANSIYAPSLQNYLEVFQRDQLLVVDGDELVHNPLPVIQKVQKFLKVSNSITAQHFYFNETKGFWCNVILGCMDSKKGRKHEVVKPELISRLRTFYAPYNKQFYELTGIDF